MQLLIVSQYVNPAFGSPTIKLSSASRLLTCKGLQIERLKKIIGNLERVIRARRQKLYAPFSK